MTSGPDASAILLTRLSIVDDVLQRHAAAIGRDLVPYRNHVYRVVNLAHHQAGGGDERVDKLAIAAVFHDLGIWTDRTFDYLGPSIRLAVAYLAANGRSPWADEVSAMIENHHKIRPSAEPSSLVEAFRRADWIDVSRGWLTFDVPRPAIATLFATWPSAGFHWRLVELSMARLRTHPLSPLPMLRL